ncbi:hypothetical protein EJ03DRAFT_296246, partial [Teratosphaeria nubilosa]
MPSPTYLYKLLESPPPSPLPETFPPTKLDAKDGFIHLSMAKQIPVTAKLFFAEHETVWLLKLRTADLDGEIKYSTEAAGGVPEGCAHLHDSEKGLGVHNIEEVMCLFKSAEEDWSDVPILQTLED